MAKITDPDQLNQGTEVVITEASKIVQLDVAGNLDDNAPGRTSGVTLQAVYSFLKEEWRTDSALNRFRFPFKAIFEAKFEFQFGWDWADAQSRDLVRDAGWLEDIGTNDEYACMISLGDFNAVSDVAYYQQVNGATAPDFQTNPVSFDKGGELNENIRIYDGTNNYRTLLSTFLRVQGKTIDRNRLLRSQGLSALTYQAYRFPLSNEVDTKIVASDATIDATAPYTGMTLDYRSGVRFTTWANSTVYAIDDVVLDPIRQSGGSSNGTWWICTVGGTSSGTGTADDVGVTWVSYGGEEQIGTEWFAYNRTINGNGGTVEEIYEWFQRALRKAATDINDNVGGDGFGIVEGDIAIEGLRFIGDELQSFNGTKVVNFDANDTNSIALGDITVDTGGLDDEQVATVSTLRRFPFVAAGTIVFSDNLVAEPDANTLFNMYFREIQRDTGIDISVTGAAGASAVITTTTTDVSHIGINDYFLVTGFLTNPDNNGLKQADANFIATGGAYTDAAGRTQVNETAGDSVDLDWQPFESPDAIVVDDNAAADIGGQITQKNEAFDFDYDNNVQGGRAAATDAAVVIVAIGTAGAEWIDAEFTITRATGLSFPVNAGDERVYSNP